MAYSDIDPKVCALINCYYYAPHVHSMLLEHLDHDLAHIADLGADAVSICVQEGHLERWFRKRLERVVRRARAHGLAVHAVPNRWGGLIAGWCEGFDGWSVAHAHRLMPGKPPHQAFADPTHPDTREHYQTQLRRLFDFFDFEGLVWDEPCPGTPEVIQLLDEMSAVAKRCRPGLTVSMFAESHDLHLAPVFARTRHIDYLGADGHVRSIDHEMERMKTTLFESHDVFYPALHEAGKRTMFLLEAQRHQDEDLENYLEHVEQAFDLPMDQLMFYYSSHEMLDPDKERRFNHATWSQVRRVAAGRKPVAVHA